MRRIVCTELGDPGLLRLVEDPTPRPGTGQVLVGTEACGVSFVDGLVVRGGYQVRPPLPFTPGNCFAGVVMEVGEGADPGLLGSRVAGVTEGLGGAYSSHVVARADGVAPVPEGLAPELVAANIESYLTMAFATEHRVTIVPGETVVVLGAGGGIGLAAVDIARALEAQVVAVASSAEKQEAALRAGAWTAIGYDDLKDRIREVTGGAGADVVVDPVGGEAAESALRALATDGRFCVLGFASGEIPRLPANIVLLRNRAVVGVDWGDWSREVGGPQGNAALLTTVLERFATGELRPPAPTPAALADAGRVLGLLGTRQAVGKHVLVP
ncbi:NADPH:quinone oxidoreductase family protein [Nocardioides campestrisoli]|uniref:NADPH:quinone oxidoreductase family protein n=1 Tax=Nocardioides campestrisoli TaxID=2736757 RepID=UPI00163D4747|nr:NADPH:quinone oxidoreductase family protein [Nocardioides campestrisoli]